MPLCLNLETKVVLPATGRSRADFTPFWHPCEREQVRTEESTRNHNAVLLTPSPRAASIHPMKCLLINLDRSTDRLAHMTAEFARLGVVFERMAAIDGKDRPDFDAIPMHADRVIKLRLTGSEIGCLQRGRSPISAGSDRRRSSRSTTTVSISVLPVPSAARTRYRRRQNGDVSGHTHGRENAL